MPGLPKKIFVLWQIIAQDDATLTEPPETRNHFMSRPTVTMIVVQNPTDTAMVAVHARRNVINQAPASVMR